MWLMILVLKLNDKVAIQNCPPVSARKRFALYKVLKSPENERIERHRVQAETAATATAAEAQPSL